MPKIIIPEIYPVACHTDNVGHNTTFVAIKGMQSDGLNYIIEAISKGATKVVMQKNIILKEDILKHIEANKIKVEYVDDTRKALAIYSAKAANYPAKKLKILGITGTKGKTTTAFLTRYLLKELGYKTALLSTVKNYILDQEFPAHLTTAQPDYLHVFLKLCLENNVDYVILEVAAQAITLNRLHGIELDGVIWTNFSLEHSEFYESLESYYNAKLGIFDLCKEDTNIILNSDETNISNLEDVLRNRNLQNIIKIGLNKTDIYAVLQESSLNGLKFKIYKDQKEYFVNMPNLIGEFNIYNILSACALLNNLGISISFEKIPNLLSNFRGVPGRLQKIILPNNAIAFIDYAHNPSSFTACLSTLRSLTKNLIVIFGCGGDRDKNKRPIMGKIASDMADHVIITSDNPRSEDPQDIIKQIISGINQDNFHKIETIIDRELAIYKAYKLSTKNSIIALLGKGPDEYQIINGVKTYFSEFEILRSLN